MMNRFYLLSSIFVYFCFCAKLIYGDHFASEENCNRSLVLAISGVSQLMRFDMETEAVHIFTPTTSLAAPIAAAADQEEGLVFFTDVSFRKIYKKDFKTGSDTVVIKNLALDSIADGIAVDPVLKKIFYSDYAEGRYSYIHSIDYEGNSGEEVLTDSENLHRPRAVLLDIDSQVMYYTDWGDTPHIAKAGYTGSSVQLLLDTGLLYPNGLTEDFSNNKIYYCDAGTDAVGALNTDGTGHSVLFQNTLLNLHFFDIIRVHDLLYVSNWNGQNGVIEMNLEGNNARGYINVEGNIRVNGIVEICFPADGTSQPFQPDASISTTTTTITTTNPTTPTTTTTPTTPTTTTSATPTTPTTTTTTTSTTPATTTTTSTTTTTITPAASTPTSTTQLLSTTRGSSGSNSSSGKEGLSQTMIIVIGMSLLALVVIILIVSATLCCMCRKQSGARTPKHGGTHQQHDNKVFDPPPQYLTPLDVDPTQPPAYRDSADPPYITSDYLHVTNMHSGIYEQLDIYESIREK